MCSALPATSGHCRGAPPVVTCGQGGWRPPWNLLCVVGGRVYIYMYIYIYICVCVSVSVCVCVCVCVRARVCPHIGIPVAFGAASPAPTLRVSVFPWRPGRIRRTTSQGMRYYPGQF